MMKVLKFLEILQEDMIYNFPKELYTSEGLIRSFDYDKMINLLKKLFNEYNISFNYNLEKTGIYLIINRKDLNNKKDFISKLEKLLNVGGYTVSNYSAYSKTGHDVPLKGKGLPTNDVIFSNKYGELSLNLNKKYDSEIMEGIPKFLYHVTRESNLPKIEKRGLIPSSLNRIEKHPDRVYLFDSLGSAEHYIELLRFRFDIQDLIILKIDTRLTNKLILRYDPKFYISDHNIGAVYTDNHFSPHSIIDNIKPNI